MANAWFLKGFERLAVGDVNWPAAANIKLALEKDDGDNYVFDQTHATLADLKSNKWNEVDVASYTPRGVLLSGKTISIDTVNKRVEFQASTVNFGTLEAGQSVASILVYIDSGTDSTSFVLGYINELVSQKLPVALDGTGFTVTPDVEGLFQLRNL